MEIDSSESSNWLFDYGFVEQISVPGDPFPSSISGSFSWAPQPLDCCFNTSAEVDCSFRDSDSLKEVGHRKRLRPESCIASASKACREKLRRDWLNERFLELGSILEPGRPPKTDKAAILADAIRMVTQLRSKAQKLKESNEDLQVKIKELKAEKNELRDEKQRLKADKEKLEQQVKATITPQGFLAHPTAMSTAFAAQGQVSSNKLIPFVGYPSIAMWQFMPPTAVDTSLDHVLRPPVA
ncbi:transcription factor ILR3 [Quercus suber]|uniref:transcription factor ILR3 n=1 Tax=Quercus suber TaxID=58331 RepID=UPI0032DEB808